MISERWEDVFAVFDTALAMSGEERDEFLARECRDNARLRDKVESLLTAHRDAEGFLSRAPVRATQASAGPSSPVARSLAPGTRSACSKSRASPALVAWAKSIEPAIRGSTVTSR